MLINRWKGLKQLLLKCLLLSCALSSMSLSAREGDQSLVSEGTGRYLGWKDTLTWWRSLRHSRDFFRRYAYDYRSTSFVSEIDVDGTQLSSTRYLIASSRLLYGLAHSMGRNEGFQKMAEQQARFILKKMTSEDSQGPYLLSSVDANGFDLNKQTVLLVEEQAYGLCGLVALYSRTRHPALLKKIESLYHSFYSRFHDDKFGGFFDGFDLYTGKPVPTKSFDSTVSVATAFLLELAQLKTPHQHRYVSDLEELLDIMAEHFPDPETDWIVENFAVDWQPAWRDWQRQDISEENTVVSQTQTVTIGVTGHNYQLAWVLQRGGTEFPSLNAMKKAAYLRVARQVLSAMMNSSSWDREFGGVFDTFVRETDSPMWHKNKVWWQQAEAMLAMGKAVSIGLFRRDRETEILLSNHLAKTHEFYFSHFIDEEEGGEFSVVKREGEPVVGEPKGQKSKSIYHTAELARYMIKYAQQIESKQ